MSMKNMYIEINNEEKLWQRSTSTRFVFTKA